MPNASPFKPLKAVQEKLDFDDIEYPKLFSLKIDGAYSVNLNSNLLSRSLKPFANKWIGQKLSGDLFEGFIGEIIHANLTDPELRINRASACRETTSCTNTKEKTDWDFLWVMFDYIGDGTKEYAAVPYTERMKTLFFTLDNVGEFQSIISIAGFHLHHYILEGDNGKVDILFPSLKEVESADDARALYIHAVENGGEGTVGRKPDGAHKFGRSTKKSQEFVRFKPEGTGEIIVTGFEQMFQNNNEAKINELGYTERSSHKENKVAMESVGAIIGIDLATGEETKIGAGTLDWDERAAIWADQQAWIGRISSFAYMDSGKKDKYRHPRHKLWRNLKDMDADAVIAFAKEKGVYLNVSTDQ